MADEAHDNVEAVIAELPDFTDLMNRLEAQVPGCVAHVSLERHSAALVVTLTADHTTKGALDALSARWPGADSHTTPTGEAPVDRASGGTLTITMPAASLVAFLAWHRQQPPPKADQP
jgi:hypothetical protein